jgi:hypothetical protein
VGEQDFHDGTVLGVRTCPDNIVAVVGRGWSEKECEIEFQGVESVNRVAPEYMRE